jgi:hypothetical protein
MWWLWVIVGLAVVLGFLFFVSRGKGRPDRQTVREHRRGDGGDGSPGPQGPGIGGGMGI